MKNFLILFSILSLALFVRFYNFSDRITFGPEQARSLIVSANYLQDKPSLLGQEYFRANSLGHKLFTSAIFNYSLVPLLLTTNYDPYPITIFFGLLNIFTGIVFYAVCKKMFSEKVAIVALILFLFNSYMIYHSMFIWVLNYLPLLGIISMYLLWKVIKKKSNNLEVLFLGILSGIGFGLEYLYLIAIVIVLFIIYRYSKQNFKSLLLFGVGGAIGDFPQIIFDLKHNFYHLRSLWQYSLDTFSGSSDAGFTYYHFLEFWPVVLLLLAFGFMKLYSKNKFIALVLLIGYTFINLDSTLISFKKPVGMLEGLTYHDVKTTSKIIAEMASDDFNIVTLYDFDTRGYTLRYFVRYVYDRRPLGDIEYQNPKEIYALAKTDYDFKSDTNPWELNVYKPYNTEKIENIGTGFALFKLTK